MTEQHGMSDAWSLEESGALTARRARALLVLAACGVGLALLRAFEPSGVVLLAPCPFHALTGLYCPGCGSLRALHQALCGNLDAALGLNALAVPAVALVAYHFMTRAVTALSWRRAASPLDSVHSARIVLIAVLAFWVLRNVPLHPLSALAP